MSAKQKIEIEEAAKRHPGDVIRSRLRQLNQTQSWLALKLNVSNNAVSLWINTGSIPKKQIPPLRELLGLSSDQLMGLAEAREKPLGVMLTYITWEEQALLQAYREMADNDKALVRHMIEGLPRTLVKGGGLSVVDQDD